MLGAALLYDLREGTVVSVKRGGPAKPALFATVTIEYPSSDGTTRTLISRIHNSSKDFDRLQPGMKVKVMECATDPGIAFMLGGHSDAGSKKCELAGTSP